jgi:cytochrome c oxidase cbb3-type subunit I/II
MIFSLMLWAPSWGGMINGLLTLKGAWDLLRTEPVVKFFVGGITFYAMSTFEGPLLSIKSVSSLGHYTDWIVGHAHSGALGWNGLMTFGMIYYLVPKLWNTQLYSKKIAEQNFWISTAGIVVYYVSMTVAGITQGLMWRAVDADGKLKYPDFVQTVETIQPLYWIRALGGLLFILGFVLFVYNIVKTIKNAPQAAKDAEALVSKTGFDHEAHDTHGKIEGMGFVFGTLILIAVLVGSVIEIYPTLSLHKYIDKAAAVNPYTPLELAGRDIYISEGCYVCHSQMIRPMSSEVLRYGKASTIEDSMWDHPFQWGSKRTGPDLARVGKKYPNMWHYQHMIDPRAINQASLMPGYKWLERKGTDFSGLKRRVAVMKQLGVPYDENTLANADEMARKQAAEIAGDLEKSGAPKGLEDKQVVALIAYLQSLGQKGQ